MKKEIAIIGISMQIADTENLEDFWEFIETGRTGFQPLSAIRQKDIFDRFGEFEIAKGSFLERVDLFDNNYFKISPAEAERMDPEQRLMLEHAVKAVNNAGYLAKDLKQQRISIFHTFEDSRYKLFFDDFSNLSLASHMPGMVGTRVANFMDWRGPVIGIETTCSSGLSALYYACQSLINGDCSMALVGGVSLKVNSKEFAMSAPIISKKGACLPFDSDADGTLGGEGVICVLLKIAEDAIRDGDPIHAIIKGGAVNHGGALIQNISAPSPVAQSEVIRKAWEDSKIDPKDIKFIEAHGTGTILGDPIEFSGVHDAFEGMVEKGTKVCTISSVKGQVGHLGTVAGLAGLLRLVLALKNNKLLPQPGLKKINDHINEQDSHVGIQMQLEQWESDHPRIGGVSSFGLTGTNVHMILGEYPMPETIHAAQDDQQTYIMKIGGSNPNQAAAIEGYLKHYIKEHPAVNLAQLCYSVNKLQDEHHYGQLIMFKDHEELELVLNDKTYTNARKKEQKQQVLLLIPGILSWQSLTSFKNQSKPLTTAYEFELKHAGYQHEHLNDDQQSLLLHYCAAKLLIRAGFSPDKIIGAQSGKLISLLLTEKITIPEAIDQLKSGNNNEDAFNKDRFIQFLHSLDAGTNYSLVIMGSSGEMYDTCKQWIKKYAGQNMQVIAPVNESNAFLEIIAAWYNQGNDLNFEELFTKELFLHDLHLPLLEPKRFWPNVKLTAPAIVENTEIVVDNTLQQANMTLEEIIEEVHIIWKETLKVDQISRQDDFFDLGGTSLLGLDVLQHIEKRFNVSLGYADIFDYCTIQAQAELIVETLAKPEEQPVVAEETKQEATRSITDDDHRQVQYDQLIQEIKDQQAIATITPQNILLTGGTGFLGAFVIKELLDKTQATINCLVRATTDEIASERLISTLQLYFPDHNIDYNRIYVYKGDITQADLDLSTSATNRLTNIDTVYHLAANVSHFGKIELSDKINFKGTVNVLEWSKKAGVIYFNHFSTTAIAGGYINNVDRINFYETDSDLGQDYGRSVYSVSKFKAEEYLRERKEHLHVNIFRIGNIGGDSVTGLFQKNIDSNSFYQRVRTLAGLGYYCDEILQYPFETTPVDIVSEIVVQLSLYKNESLNTFHIAPDKPIRLQQMVEQFANYDIELKRTDFDSFFKHAQKLSTDPNLSAGNMILGILRYNNNDTPVTHFTLKQDATKAYLDKIGINYTYNMEQYANTIIKYCLETKFINPIAVEYKKDTASY